MADIKKLTPIILKWEGGFVNDKADKGGATNKGVTLSTWKQCGYDKDNDGDIDIDDIKLLTVEDATVVLKKYYWDRWRADEINNQSVANILVDWVWGSGVWGIKRPQRLLNLNADGIVGSLTLKAINQANQSELFKKIWNDRLLFLNEIVNKSVSKYLLEYPRAKQKELLQHTNLRFKQGWINRLNDFKYIP